MTRVSAFTQGSLAGESLRSESLAELFPDEFDAAVVVPSWDERCIGVTTTAIAARMGLVVSLSGKDPAGRRDKLEARIVEFIRGRCRETMTVAANSLDPDSMWLPIDKRLRKLAGELGRPLAVMLEGSTCPRYLSLAIIGSLLQRGIVRRLAISYSEARYPNKDPTALPHDEVAFTGGSWRAVPVPGLEGEYDPAKARFYLLSVGFEGAKTLRVVTRADPDRVSVLFPEPGYFPRVQQANTNRQRCVASAVSCSPRPGSVRDRGGCHRSLGGSASKQRRTSGFGELLLPVLRHQATFHSSRASGRCTSDACSGLQRSRGAQGCPNPRRGSLLALQHRTDELSILVSCPRSSLQKKSLQKRSGGCHFDREPASEDRTNCLIVRDIEILRSAQDDRPLPKKLLKESLGHDTSPYTSVNFSWF